MFFAVLCGQKRDCKQVVQDKRQYDVVIRIVARIEKPLISRRLPDAQMKDSSFGAENDTFVNMAVDRLHPDMFVQK